MKFILTNWLDVKNRVTKGKKRKIIKLHNKFGVHSLGPIIKISSAAQKTKKNNKKNLNFYLQDSDRLKSSISRSILRSLGFL